MASYPFDMPAGTGSHLVRRPLGWALTPADVLPIYNGSAESVTYAIWLIGEQ